MTVASRSYRKRDGTHVSKGARSLSTEYTDMRLSVAEKSVFRALAVNAHEYASPLFA